MLGLELPIFIHAQKTGSPFGGGDRRSPALLEVEAEVLVEFEGGDLEWLLTARRPEMVVS